MIAILYAVPAKWDPKCKIGTDTSSMSHLQLAGTKIPRSQPTELLLVVSCCMPEGYTCGVHEEPRKVARQVISTRCMLLSLAMFVADDPEDPSGH